MRTPFIYVQRLYLAYIYWQSFYLISDGDSNILTRNQCSSLCIYLYIYIIHVKNQPEVEKGASLVQEDGARGSCQ